MQKIAVAYVQEKLQLGKRYQLVDGYKRIFCGIIESQYVAVLQSVMPEDGKSNSARLCANFLPYSYRLPDILSSAYSPPRLQSAYANIKRLLFV